MVRIKHVQEKRPTEAGGSCEGPGIAQGHELVIVCAFTVAATAENRGARSSAATAYCNQDGISHCWRGCEVVWSSRRSRGTVPLPTQGRPGGGGAWNSG